MISLYVILGLSAFLFLFVPLAFRSNAVYGYLLLIAGELASKQVSVETTKFLNSIFTGLSLPMYSIVQIFILIFGSALVLFLYRKTSKPKDLIFNIVVGASASLVATFLVVSKLSYDQKNTIENLSLYQTLDNFIGVAVVTGLLGSLFYFVFHKSVHISKHDKKHK
jgi:hypothetical protein